MAEIEIVPATAAHARALGCGLRPADRREIVICGLDPERTVTLSFEHSVLRRTALVGGRVAAMWGVTGTPLGIVGCPWLLTGLPALEVSPIRFARLYKAQVADMLRLFPLLENYVDASYAGAIRMLELAGFRLDDPAPYVAGSSFRRFEARV